MRAEGWVGVRNWANMMIVLGTRIHQLWLYVPMINSRPQQCLRSILLSLGLQQLLQLPVDIFAEHNLIDDKGMVRGCSDKQKVDQQVVRAPKS